MDCLRFEFAASLPGLTALTTLRGGRNLGFHGPDPAEKVVEARRRLWAHLGLPLERSVFLRQVHGDRLEILGPRDAGRGALSLEDAIPNCDAALAPSGDLLLCVGHADCLAIVLVDPARRACGAAHAGWRGASLRVAAKLARAMREQLGCDPARIQAGLSPCLGPCHLQLSELQYPLFEGMSGRGQLQGSHFFLDLWECCRSQLLEEGLRPEHIEIQRYCTACRNDLLFSHRAEKGCSGRQMTIVGYVS